MDRYCERDDNHEGHQWHRLVPSRSGGKVQVLSYCPGLGELADKPAETLPGNIL